METKDVMNKLEDNVSGRMLTSEEPVAKKVKLSVSEMSEFGSNSFTPIQEIETCSSDKKDLSLRNLQQKNTSIINKELRERDDMEETLLCSICHDILHDCISLQPCMHSFCSGCYSPWMDVSSECPQCRNKVERINRNHIVNNLVEVYLKEHPEKKRSEDDLKELDIKNKITQDMLCPKKKKRLLEDLDDDEFSDGSEVYSDDIYSDDDPLYPGQNIGTPFSTICRQCPGFITSHSPSCVIPPPVLMTVTTVAGIDQPSMVSLASVTSEVSLAVPEPGTSTRAPVGNQIPAVPSQYVCLPQQTHITCQCCMQPMPDRRIEHITGISVPAQQCIYCDRAFCHLYWGCKKSGCFGCMGSFSELNFGEKCLNDLINENLHESQIFRDYMKLQNLSWKDLLKDCLAKLDDGTYTCSGQHIYQFKSTAILCIFCGLRNFRELAYQYRKNIPIHLLPTSTPSRPDCYWGKNCRTQRTKLHHAQRFNHICEQVRWNN